jgi:hypothetical protein
MTSSPSSQRQSMTKRSASLPPQVTMISSLEKSMP